LAERRAALAAAEAKLRDVETQLTDKLRETRLNLGHLDDHVLRLRDRIARLQADYDVLQQSEVDRNSTREEQQAALARLAAEIDKAKVELEQARRAADARPRSFAIVPYDGPNGTRRRPIYIECRADQIIMQPEGVVLTQADFTSPIDAGNPLAAGLRATREYWLETGVARNGEPYPLLLVRPEGAQMYAIARAAMQPWSSEYGYELLDADMQLEYPPADEALGDVVRRTVALARKRNEMLAMQRGMSLGMRGAGGGAIDIGPASRGGPGGTYLSASRTGGFELHGRRPEEAWLDRHVGTTGGPLGALGERAGESEGGGTSQQNTGSGGANNLAAAGGTNISAGGNGQRPAAFSGASTNPASYAGQTPSGGAAGAASSGTPGGPQAFGQANMQATGQGAAGGNSGSCPTCDNPGASGGPPPTALAGQRGENWALPSSAQGATAFTRPIRVACYADRLVVLPDRGSTDIAKITPIAGSVANSVDKFVADLWQHMNAWGMAGPRAYWKPILSVEVAAGGESRFVELAALMRDSGVEVERK
ncbi:MAG: hypothetical protein KDA41_05535, partial [Planctomycetales bacterium]|nr:hypothetical protein [Planctomycetales bacterium]